MTPIDHFRAVLFGDMKRFAAALGLEQDDERVRRFLSMAISVPEAKPELLDCDARSFVTALLNCALSGLSPDVNLGFCYFIPRKSRVYFQIGYRGWMHLTMSGGAVSHFEAACVKSEDQFDFENGTAGFVRHRPSWRGNYIAAYAIAYLHNGQKTHLVVPWESDDKDVPSVLRSRKRSDADQYAQRTGKRERNAWDTDLEAMALRLPLKILCTKRLDPCPAVQKAMAIEEMIEAELGEIIEARALTTAEALRQKMLPDQVHRGTSSPLVVPAHSAAAPQPVPSGSGHVSKGGTEEAGEPAASDSDLLDLDFDESKIPKGKTHV